jgi:hypothetical protein
MKAGNLVIDPTNPRYKVHAPGPEGKPDCYTDTEWQNPGHICTERDYERTSRPVDCGRCLNRQLRS